MTTWFKMWENNANRKAVAAVVCPEPENTNSFSVHVHVLDFTF